jgi:hypothetical protein
MYGLMETPPSCQPGAPPRQADEPPDEPAFVDEVLRGLARQGWIVTMRCHPSQYVCELDRPGRRVTSEPCASRLQAVVQAAARASMRFGPSFTGSGNSLRLAQSQSPSR